jgi:L-threonylcarbamoyladenylate synthase
MGAHSEILDGYDAASIGQAVHLLKRGDVVAFPTETVYGLGADALNRTGVAKIFEMKKRPHFDPLIVHIGQKDWLPSLVKNVPAPAQLLIEKFWPGPLTIIFKKQPTVPDIVTAGLDTVAIRMPSHPVALDLIRTFRGPIAAPSANPFGYMSPTRAAHVARMFEKEKLPLVLDGGPAAFGLESTIVAVKDQQIFLRRHGSVSLEELEELLGTVDEGTKNRTDYHDPPDSPGQLPYHYAPHKPLRIIKSLDDIKDSASSVLLFRSPTSTPVSRYVKVLSPAGNLREAAANFFSYLIELDRDDIHIIYAEQVPEQGLGRAIMERLRRASRKSVQPIDSA